MAFSVNTPVGDGVTKQFAVNFTNGLFSRDSVHVFVEGEVDGLGEPIERTFTFINDGLIELDGAAPANGATVEIRRIMDKNGPAVDFADGEILTEATADRGLDHLINSIHELLDGYGFSSLRTAINMNSNPITGLEDVILDPTSAVSRAGATALVEQILQAADLTPGGGVGYLDTVAELKNTSGLFDGQQVFVLGVSDSSGLIHVYWDSTSTATADDVDVFSVAGAGAGRWITTKIHTEVGEHSVQESINRFTRNTSGQGSDLIAHTGTSDTVTEALDKRTIYVGSVAELESLPSPITGQMADVQGGKFLYTGSDWEPKNHIPIMAWDAAGDGVADDTQPVLDAVSSGYPIDWQDKEYRTTDGIAATLSKDINWKSSGAVIKLDSAAPVESVVICDITGGYQSIQGKLTFDANNNAYAGCVFENPSEAAYPEGYATFEATGLSARNVYRSSTDFPRGEGILIRGSFEKVILTDPEVNSVKMAAGAGVAFSVGVAGIAIVRGQGARGFPVYSKLVNPVVRDVFSEDDTYELDQDGCKLFGAADEAGSMFTHFDVEGGAFENCYGRSIKGQTRTGRVAGTVFKRNAGFASRVGNPEIDFQTGEGDVTDITGYYDGYVPGTMVNQAGSEHHLTFGTVKAVKAYISGAAPSLPAVVTTYPRSNDFTQHSTASDIAVQGSVDFFAKINTPDNSAVFDLRKAVATEVVEAGVELRSSGSGSLFGASVNMENVRNYGGDVLLIEDRISGVLATARGSQNNCSGFLTSRRHNLGDPKQEVTKVKKLAGDYVSGGVQSMYSETIADGAEFGFPAHGFEGVAICLLIAGNNNRSTAGFAKSSFGTTEFFKGDQVEIAGPSSTSPPATGNWKVWAEGGIDGRTFVRNDSGSSRQVTLFYFG